jgi:SAM-dependent methyltransferase
VNNRPSWAPTGAEIEQPSPARIYDYFLGGSHNFAADRELAREYMEKLPDMPQISRANRYFLGRAVRHLVGEAGIAQFLDLGSGLPAQGSTHEVARQLDSRAKVVYVDIDPVTVEFGRSLLGGTPGVSIAHGDLRDPGRVLADAAATGLIDFTRPLAVLMVAMLHFVPDEDDPAALVAAYRDACAPGSHLVISHATNEYHPQTMREAAAVYNKSASQGMNFRTRDQIAALLSGFDLVEPGLVDVIHWRPQPGDRDPFDGDVTRYNLLAALGRKPADGA